MEGDIDLFFFFFFNFSVFLFLLCWSCANVGACDPSSLLERSKKSIPSLYQFNVTRFTLAGQKRGREGPADAFPEALRSFSIICVLCVLVHIPLVIFIDTFEARIDPVLRTLLLL